MQLKRLQLTGESQDQHRVAVAEKAVFAGNRLSINFVEPGDSVGRTRSEKCRYKAEERRARLMKVRDQRVDPAEGTGRENEDFSLGDISAGDGPVVVLQEILNAADGGGSDGHFFSSPGSAAG